MPIIPFIPLIVAGVGAGASAYSAHKQSSALKEAAKGPEAIANAQEARANQAFSMGTPMVQQAGSYYDTLLHGGRSQMAQATAGPRAAITDQYRGAERNLERSGVRGGVRDLAKAELGRSRAGTISSLTTGVQPMAAGALADLGTATANRGVTGLGSAGGMSTSIMAQLLQQQRFNSESQGQAGNAMGSMFFDILNGIGNRQQRTPLPSRTTTPPYVGNYPVGGSGNLEY